MEVKSHYIAIMFKNRSSDTNARQDEMAVVDSPHSVSAHHIATLMYKGRATFQRMTHVDTRSNSGDTEDDTTLAAPLSDYSVMTLA